MVPIIQDRDADVGDEGCPQTDSERPIFCEDLGQVGLEIEMPRRGDGDDSTRSTRRRGRCSRGAESG